VRYADFHGETGHPRVRWGSRSGFAEEDFHADQTLAVARALGAVALELRRSPGDPEDVGRAILGATAKTA
jgi:hypothetical protein